MRYQALEEMFDLWGSQCPVCRRKPSKGKIAERLKKKDNSDDINGYPGSNLAES